MRFKVSVVIPVYNMEKYIIDCLNSIVRQTLSDIEVIVINDGSTDNSGILIRDFIKEYSNINYYFQDNRGVSIARNKGIACAKGEYIYFLDSDDCIAEDFLESCYNKATSEKADFVVCGEADWEEGLKTPPCVWSASIFVKRDLLKKHDLKFPEKIQPCEDGLLSHFLFAVAEKVVQVKDVKYFYRWHVDSNSIIIENRPDEIFKQIPLWLDVLEDFYNKKNLWDENILHIALFFQKEPFSRFSRMSFSINQKKALYNLLINFYNKYLKNKLKREDFKFFNKNFRCFISSKNFNDYFVKTRIKSFLNNIFYLKNEYCNNKKYKVFTIFGFKNKIEIKTKGKK